MSARPNKTEASSLNTTTDLSSAIEALAPDAANLAEGNAFSTAAPENPLQRRIVVSIRASLSELCLQKNKATWAPSQEALKSMFQQKKFTSLEGSADNQGDLKSIVLHKMQIDHSRSTFPVALGARITGVDDASFSSTGEAYSAIVLPQSENSVGKTLQADDVSLAYEFSKKFPGYTSENLAEKGVHEVAARRFVLVAADHPIVSAISENADKLQMGEIAMMPEGLVKISTSLYESILPLVKTQVESQIKVRDFSKASVSVSPAEYTSWSDARSALMVEAKRPLKAQLQAELAAAEDEETCEKIRAAFNSREKGLEHDLDHKPMSFDLELSVGYNFLSK